MSRSWPLSQDANKSSGPCRVCHATFQLHLRDGAVHRHGPRKNPCAGSHKPPLNADTSSDEPSRSLPASDGLNNISSAQSSISSGLNFSPVAFGIIKHIPKSARIACASHLASLLRQVVSHPDTAVNWQALFNWTGFVLSAPRRAGKRHNVASTIKKRVADFTASESPAYADRPMSQTANSKRDSSHLARAVAAKLEDGNLKAAVRLLVSDEAPVMPSAESLAKLKEKHPPGTLDSTSLPAPLLDSSLTVSEIEVQKAIASFPAGSSAGPDGFRPQHLKDLVNCNEAGADLLTAVTAFVNLVLAGRCPDEVAPIFFGGRLIALNKKSGGIRPIVIGLTLRRLVSKCANTVGISRLQTFFCPRQLGVGTPGGCEAAIHSARRYLQSMPVGKVVVKLDFANAFNSLHRHDMLLAVKDHVPELYAYSYSAYAQPSLLYYGPFTLFSSEGPQQGDPLGPLLFSLSVQPLLESVSSEITLGYLDDFTLGDAESVVASDVKRIVEVGQTMGLALSTGKCELIAHPETVVSDAVLQSFKRLEPSEATLLGAPILPGERLDACWSERCADLTRAVDRLKMIGAQDALTLLRSSFSAPKVQHLLRCSPAAGHPALDVFDQTLRSALCWLTNSTLTDAQWLQASQPIRDGGLGVRRVSTLALSAFLASAAGTQSLQEAILFQCQSQPDALVQSLTASWNSSFGLEPIGLSAGKQSAWDRPGIKLVNDQLMASLNDEREKATFLAATAPHSGAWLSALPIAACGLRLDDEAVRVAVALRLGLNVCVPHQCPCGADVDAWGQHAWSCKHAAGRIQRHHALNDVIARALTAAGIPVSKEPSGLFHNDVRRPDGITLVPWQAGKAVAWDVTVASTLADSYVRASSTSSAAAAEQAAYRKSVKYADLPASFQFQPIAVETLGPINDSATDFLDRLGQMISARTNEVRERMYLYQRISITIQRFNAVLLHDTFSCSNDPDL